MDGSDGFALVMLLLCGGVLARTVRGADRFARDHLAWKRAARAGNTAEAEALMDHMKRTYPRTDFSHPSFRV